ncbi:MAG: hypothetical protein A2W91_05775 [Bacteroidetes bacterium GWF2_38_335]|nr:MAG: hypothetical protein A2W91_05775 [Bacteroidetes bacterium GWF2_38_335]OFY81586.1 MAG: hypothetical protein A2281_11570 [Bacteroidetes bacterium RIFOXYA12_FULL_38_20]HBS88934.1 hypothetical protein [Bacteroidales bacterium]
MKAFFLFTILSFSIIIDIQSQTGSNLKNNIYSSGEFKPVENDLNSPKSDCDTIDNLYDGESLTYLHHPELWGYLPGHNGDNIVTYAEKFEGNTLDAITSIILPVAKAYSAGGTVRFTIWDGDSIPTTILGYKEYNIGYLLPGLFNYIEFYSPIPVNESFFIGFEISYEFSDTFAIYMASNRGSSGVNTIYCQKSGTWYQAPDLYDLHSSLAISVIGCLTENKPIAQIEESIKVFPNPSDDIIYIELESFNLQNIDVKVLDITGKVVCSDNLSINNGLFKFNLEQLNTGIYILQLKLDETLYNKQISITK